MRVMYALLAAAFGWLAFLSGWAALYFAAIGQQGAEVALYYPNFRVEMFGFVFASDTAAASCAAFTVAVVWFGLAALRGGSVPRKAREPNGDGGVTR